MDWTPKIIIALMAIAILNWQGFLLLKQKGLPSNVCGVLDLLVVVSGTSAIFFFAAGALLLSPEYGVLLVQGRPSWFWPRVSLVGLSLGMGLLLYAACCVKKEEKGKEKKR